MINCYRVIRGLRTSISPLKQNQFYDYTCEGPDIPLSGHGPYLLSTGNIHKAGHIWGNDDESKNIDSVQTHPVPEYTQADRTGKHGCTRSRQHNHPPFRHLGADLHLSVTNYIGYKDDRLC